MSALGQKRTRAVQLGMCALGQKRTNYWVVRRSESDTDIIANFLTYSTKSAPYARRRAQRAPLYP
jgi:hypothetical protein